MKHILVIDDDIYINDMLEESLTEAGYRVSHAYSGTEALMVLKNGEPSSRPDLILLDLMLPGLQGEELINHIKDIPTIVISAKADLSDKVNLLGSGAVDYVTKPFQLKELLARISVHLRLSAGKKNSEVIRYDDIEIDTSVYTVRVAGKEVKLTPTEYAILKLLAENSSRVISKSQILDRISLDTPDCTESSLKTHISNLRKKLRDASDGSKEYIEAVWGVGFIMP